MTDRRSDAVLVHFYRAVVSHMDVWRQRMDATTNWSAATAAGMITFSFHTTAAPHYVLLIALLFQGVFLVMEARRYQTFDLWRRRFRMLNRSIIVPALRDDPLDDSSESQLRELAGDMGRTVPHLQLSHAVGYRMRRNYGYLFGVTLLAWLMKLEIHPAPAGSIGALLDRANIAFVPGSVIVIAVFGSVAALLLLALAAPTGDIVDWQATPARWDRWSGRLRSARGAWPRRGRSGSPTDHSNEEAP